MVPTANNKSSIVVACRVRRRNKKLVFMCGQRYGPRIVKFCFPCGLQIEKPKLTFAPAFEKGTVFAMLRNAAGKTG